MFNNLKLLLPHLGKKNTFSKTYTNLNVAGFEPVPFWKPQEKRTLPVQLIANLIFGLTFKYRDVPPEPGHLATHCTGTASE